MIGPTSLRWRALRSTAFAGVATGIAALGHTLGGGAAPDIAMLVIGGAGAGAVTVGLARQRRGPRAILAAMLACQLGFHLLFSVDGHHLATAAPAGGSAGSTSPVRMVAFHLVAAAVSAVILGAGERALFGLFAALARSVRIVRPPAAVELPPRWTVRFVAPEASRPDGPLLSTSPRRGPPAALGRPIGRRALPEPGSPVLVPARRPSTAGDDVSLRAARRCPCSPISLDRFLADQWLSPRADQWLSPRWRRLA